MAYNLLKGKKGIIFGALDENSIAWKTALKVKEEGAEFTLTNAPIAMRMGLPFSMARKLGKLPYDKISEEYALEYGTNTVEMHTDAVNPGQRVYVVDDLLATGGTAAAAARLIERLNGSVCGFGFLVELSFLGGRENLLGYPIEALIIY